MSIVGHNSPIPYFPLLEAFFFKPPNYWYHPRYNDVLNDRPGDVWDDSIVFGTKMEESGERDPNHVYVRVDEEVDDWYCEIFRASWE